VRKRGGAEESNRSAFCLSFAAFSFGRDFVFLPFCYMYFLSRVLFVFLVYKPIVRNIVSSRYISLLDFPSLRAVLLSFFISLAFMAGPTN